MSYKACGKREKKMIKNVVFDMGQVVFYFDAGYFIEKAGASGDDIGLMYKVIFSSGKWACLDDGTMTERELIGYANERLPGCLHKVTEELILRWDRNAVEVRGMYDLIKELKDRGLKLYLLSNAGPRHRDYWKNIPASRFFDGAVVSCYEKIMKPDERLYRILLDRYSLNADECVFTDDIRENVEAAERLGMKGFVFSDNAEELREFIEGLL